jgi:glycosyltransferase involved in cell wall biosynthesis
LALGSGSTKNTLRILDPRRRLLIACQPLAEGAAQHVLDVVAGIDRDRYELDVACPRPSLLWRSLRRDPGVRLHEIAPGRGPSLADFRSLRTLLPLVRSADVVHLHSSKVGFIGRVAASLSRRRDAVIFTPHAWSFWADSGAAARLYVTLERIAAGSCRLIMVVSEAERRAGLEAGVGTPSQYRVVLNGVELERFSAVRRPVANRIIAVGRLARQKRPDVLVRMVGYLRERNPQVELHLVGDGPDRAQVEALIAELRLRDHVKLLGTRADVPALLSRAACFVLASDYEGCPLSILEAMAAGVAVVSTRVGGVPEIVEDGRTGRLVEPGDPEALARVLGDVLEDPGTLRRLGEEGRRVAAARFSRERMAAEVQQLYDETAEATASRMFNR